MGTLKREPVPPGEFELILETENVGAWMAINNAFTFDWGDSASMGRHVSRGGRNLKNSRAYWNGVLVQLGRFWGADDHQLMEGFTDIQFCSNNDVKLALKPEDFQGDSIVWINIVSDKKTAEAPVPLQDFRQWSKLGQIKEKKVFDRPSTLHHYLEPYPGGITLWHEDGYTIDARSCDTLPGARNHEKDRKHVVHTFRFGAPNRVEVLRLARSKVLNQVAQWQQPTVNGSTRPEWDPWLFEGAAPDQEAKAEGPPPSLPEKLAINRIVVTDPNCGGQQIGKNPPQN